jgi:hypothetical protein
MEVYASSRDDKKTGSCVRIARSRCANTGAGLRHQRAVDYFVTYVHHFRSRVFIVELIEGFVEDLCGHFDNLIRQRDVTTT